MNSNNPTISTICECSHHWSVHAESGQTARTAICHGYIGSATPGPLYEMCQCTRFRPWSGPRDSRTGEPVRLTTIVADALDDQPGRAERHINSAEYWLDQAAKIEFPSPMRDQMLQLAATHANLALALSAHPRLRKD